MKRYYRAPYSMKEAEDGQWVKYEDAAGYSKAAMNTAIEASKLIMENELLKRQVNKELEELKQYFAEWELVLPPDAREALRKIVEGK